MFTKLILLLLLSWISCANPDTKKHNEINVQPPTRKEIENKAIDIFVQPFTDLPEKKAEYVYDRLKITGLNVKLLSPVQLPSIAYYKPRNRYRADTLIHWLKKRISSNQVIVGLTSKDISTTKGKNPDSGIFGIGFMDGPACVASSYRLRSDDQLFKTVLHELGHNFGVPHCSVKTCLMRDSEGKNRTEEEKEFCLSCKEILTKKGWKL